MIRLLAFSFLSVIICDKTQSEQKSNSYTCMNSFSYTGTCIDVLADSPQQNIDWKMTLLQVHLFIFFYFLLYSHDRTMQDIVYKLVPNLQESKCLIKHQYIDLLNDSPQQLIIYYIMNDHIKGLSTAT